MKVEGEEGGGEEGEGGEGWRWESEGGRVKVKGYGRGLEGGRGGKVKEFKGERRWVVEKEEEKKGERFGRVGKRKN